MRATDSELVRASRAGSARAFGHLVERYQGLVRAVTYSATGDAALSEDVAQEAFLAAWHDLGSLREPERFRSWVCGIARNLARYARRHQRRHAPAATAPSERLADLAAGDPSPLEHAIERQRRELVWDALRRVPAAYREPLVLFYRESNSLEQVAALLGLSQEAVKQRLCRGRAYLRRGMEEQVAGAIRAGVSGRSLGSAVVLAIAASAAPAAAGALPGAGLAGALRGAKLASVKSSSPGWLSAGLPSLGLAGGAAVAAIALAVAVGGVRGPAGHDAPALAEIARPRTAARIDDAVADIAAEPALAPRPRLRPRIARRSPGRAIVEPGEPEISRATGTLGRSHAAGASGSAAWPAAPEMLAREPALAPRQIPAEIAAPPRTGDEPADRPRPGPSVTAREAIPPPAPVAEPSHPGPGHPARLPIEPPDLRARIGDIDI